MMRQGHADIESFALDRHFLTKNEISAEKREALKLEMFMERYADQGYSEFDHMLKIRKQEELIQK